MAVQPSELEFGFFQSCQLLEKWDAQPDAHFGNGVWEAKLCSAAGCERRMCLEARAQNLSNIQCLLQGTKAAPFLQTPAVLFFQQEEQVPHGFF